MEKVCLNLGCFDKKFPPPFINIDVREDVNPDVVDNAFELNTIKDNTVDLIYCSHMFEHLRPQEAVKALRVWNKKLKQGGILRLSVPDFSAICKRYIYTGNLKELDNLLYGSQKHDFDYHYAGYDFEKMYNLLLLNGYEDIEEWNWWSTPPHNYVDDFSRCYLPSNSPDIALSHGRFLEGDGLMMSLNIQAKKIQVLS